MESLTKGEASEKIVEETKKIYSTVLSRPLDKRQLSRPNFKFIQDLIKKLMSETKTLKDTFTTQDFDPKLVIDRHFKIKFIQKLIEFAARNGQPVTNCLPARVIAGLEPNKTNELLQSIARISKQQVNNRTVQRPRTFTRFSNALESSPRKQQQACKPDSAGNLVDQPDSPVKMMTPPIVPYIPQEVEKSQLKEEPRQDKVKVHVAKEQVFSESDVAKNIQHLQSSLRVLCADLSETTLLEDLTVALSKWGMATL